MLFRLGCVYYDYVTGSICELLIQGDEDGIEVVAPISCTDVVNPVEVAVVGRACGGSVICVCGPVPLFEHQFQQNFPQNYMGISLI